MENIDISKELSEKDFCQIFEQLPLNEDERLKIKNIYWSLYKVFVYNGVNPLEAFSATKNTFIAQERQINDRIINS